MEDSALVNVPDTFADLDHVVANLGLCEHLSVLHNVLESILYSLIVDAKGGRPNHSLMVDQFSI